MSTAADGASGPHQRASAQAQPRPEPQPKVEASPRPQPRSKPRPPAQPKVSPPKAADATAPGGRPLVVPAPSLPAERRIVSRVGLVSVLKVSIGFYLATVVLAMVALFSLWVIAEGVGIVENLEDFIADLFAYQEFSFVSWELARAVTIIGIIWVALATTLTMIAAAFYNAFADLLGGVEVTLVEDDHDRA